MMIGLDLNVAKKSLVEKQSLPFFNFDCWATAIHVGVHV
jgi:hypothetical protein